jgi:hypothetical protein
MKQYKHKTSGHIATESNSGKTYSLAHPKNTNLPKELVENSCDWELVEDEVIDNRDYEVLAYANDSDNELWVKLTDSSKYGRATARHIQLNEADLLGYAPMKIHTIKRKSDDAVFSVGNPVTPSYSEMVFGEVRKFEPVGDTIQIWGNFNGMYGMGFLNQLNPLVPKDYEVLEVINPETGSILTIQNGVCVDISSMPHANGVAIAQAMSMLDWSRLNITKIRRYSDGQIFEVGKRIRNKNATTNYYITAIKKVSTTAIHFYIDEYNNYYLLNEVDAIEPVFTTEDGVDMFNDSRYFAIEEYSKGFTVVPYYVTSNGTPNGIKQYSTHEAATNVLRFFKRNISIFDIECVFGKLGVSEYHELLKISERNGRC